MNLGSKYKISVDGDSITMAYDTLAPTSKISVISAVDTTITYKEGLKTKTMVLPDKTAYYYNGVKQSYEGLKALLQTNSSLVMTYNKDKTGFDVACIFDPVTSKPEVVSGTVVEDGKVGAIKVSKGLRIARNTIDISTATPVNTVGEIIKAVDLKDRDVLYQVSDIWGKNPYLLAVDNKITGEITGILPSNIAPKSLQIGGKSYEFSRYMNMEKYASLPTPFNIGDEVVLLLGNDGKVVDVRYPGDDSINDFAMVLNYTAKTSSGILTYGQGVYTVKLLHTNGTSATYESVTDPTYMKGTLVRYSKSTSGKVTLYSLSYASPGEVTVNKDERRIGSAFASDNIKIFNVIANDSGVDAKVQLLSWSELPSGLYPSGRITFTNQVGAFNDINAMTLSDIYNEQYSTAVIKKFDTTRTVTGGTYTYTYAYTMVVDGSDYKYTVQAPIEYADVASVLKVKVTAANKTVAYVSEVKFPGIQSTTSITAIDSKRALINGKIYLFKPGAQIYYKDNLGNINLQDVEDVEVGKTYGIVAVYLDKSLDSNGRIETILITQ